MYTGEPSYSKKKKEKEDPNGYLKTVMYDGSKPGVMLYRCGWSDTRKLTTQTCLNAVVNRALVDDTVKILTNSLADDTQTTYLKGWKMWTRFCDSRGFPPWVNTAVRNWDRNILCFLTWEHTVMKNGRDTLAKRFSAIRFLHLIAGRGDFDDKSFRIRALINGVKKKKGAGQMLPINPEMLRKAKAKLNLMTPTGSELWASLMLGFHFALRIGEIENLEDRDVSFDEIDGKTCVTIHIRSSKNDQCRLGVHRTLVATNCDLCPVMGIAQWLDMKNWHPLASKKVVTSSIATKVNQFLKNSAIECGMGPDRISTHSMRAGCATALYANGIAPIDIQRWGRWKPPVYMRYVWHENVRLHTLSYALTKKTDLSDHLLAPEQKKRKVSFDTGFRCGGKNDRG